MGYFGFLVDRIRSTAAFTVIPGSSSRAIISSLVCPRLLASRMNTLSQAVLAANWWASTSWNRVSWSCWSLMAEGPYRLVPVSLYFLPPISIGLQGNTLRKSPGSTLAVAGLHRTRFGFSGQEVVFARRYSLTTTAQATSVTFRALASSVTSLFFEDVGQVLRPRLIIEPKSQ